MNWKRDEADKLRLNGRREFACGLALFAGLMIAYHVNGEVFPSHDCLASMLQAESLLRDGDLSFSPIEVAGLLEWRLQLGNDAVPVRVNYFDEDLAVLYEKGQLQPRLDPLAVDAILPTRSPQLYVSTFPAGSAVAAAPLFLIFEKSRQPLSYRPWWFWYVAKLIASLFVAVSAVYVYRACLLYTTLWPALLIGSLYGVATNVWSVSSQALWQHPANELFLAIGTYHFLRLSAGVGHAAICGACYGMATCCRPTGALIVLVVGVYLSWTDRRALVAFVVGGLSFALLLAAYNNHFFGAPWRFGQSQLATAAVEKTGSASVFQTPPWIGLTGLLFSPSRGLFVYSPFLLLAGVGYALAWRDPRYRPLRALAVAMLAILLVESCHFDWWGGWSFGYRHVVDIVPLLMLGLVPMVPIVTVRPWLAGLAAVAVVWSIAVQVIGVWAYDAEGWNARAGYFVHVPGASQPRFTFDPATAQDWREQTKGRVEPVVANVDDPRFRYRLWSIHDSQLLYYLTHFREARRFRRSINDLLPYLAIGARADTHEEIAQRAMQAGQVDLALQSARRALRYDSTRESARRLLEGSSRPAN